jgi:predicted CXXCH cytochrome family protein
MKAHNMACKMAWTGLLGIVLNIAYLTIGWTAIPKQSIRCRGCHDDTTGPTLLPQYQGNEGCITCHSSDTSSTTYALDLGGMGQTVTVPVVVYTGAQEPTSYLAGGNFWWVKEGSGGDDTKGHNVFPGEPDDNLSFAPFKATVGCGDNSCHMNLHGEVSGTAPCFNGRQGCTKCHMMPTDIMEGVQGFHHADDSNLVVGSDSNDSDKFFRFLKGHFSTSAVAFGVCGIEDEDWEGTSDSTDHNEYLGYSGSKNAAGGLTSLGHTMTGFCCGCHGHKHISSPYAEGGDWIRHPSGALPVDASYTVYNPQNPVSRPDLSGYDGPSDTVEVTDMVMCLSCHRAHGSPYPKMLRWETVGGCDDCHISITQCAD